MTYRPYLFYRLCPEDAHTCTKPTCMTQVECAGFAKPPLASPPTKPTKPASPAKPSKSYSDIWDDFGQRRP